MTTPLRCLVCEDSEDDFDLLRMELRRAGYAVDALRVQSSADFAAALDDRNWDIVISDWSMPEFNALEALAILRDTGLDIPFIIVSGTIGEEAAVEAMRKGAHDYLLKNRLAHLGVVVERELREANTRRERAKMQEQLVISDRTASAGVLAAGVAHEINNPLAAVMANLDLALGELDAPTVDLAAVRDELADARAAAERVRDIVRDLRISSRTADEHRGPASIEKVMEAVENRPLPMAGASRRGRVLVVDDEPMIARAVHRAVAAEHDIESVTRGHDALEKIRSGARYDVIVCDLMMPEMTGMDLYEELSSFAPDQAKAMVFLTGGAFTTRAQAFLARTENLHIEKPFEPAFLRAVINDRIR